MRDSLRALVRGACPEHMGLAYDMWAPVKSGEGKVPDDERNGWFDQLERVAVPEDYALFFDRWQRSLADDGSRAVKVRLRTRLLLGHGNASPTEVGLTVHHTWGVPVIPGTALKGLLNHYVDTVFGPDPDQNRDGTGEPIHPLAPDHPSPERADYQGPTWKKRQILHGPGKVHRTLFGAPDASSDARITDELEKYFQALQQDHGPLPVGATRGTILFHDALMVPGAPSPWLRDVITVHQKQYYDAQGARGGPRDWDNPNPVTFLTVRPGTEFLVALSGPEAWTRFAMGLLLDALDEWGIGGKTTSGYGRIATEHRKVVIDPRREAGARSEVVQAFRAWMEDRTVTLPGESTPVTQAQRLALVRKDWLDKLAALSGDEQETAIRIIRQKIKTRKRVQEREALIAEIKGG